MKGQKVTIYKLGDVLRTSKDPMIMIISDGDDIITYYVSLLMKNSKLLEEFSTLKTAGGIISQPSKNPLIKNSRLSGIADDYPKSGQIFTINDSSWHTSRVELVIEGCILVTRNSIYAIHSESFLRDKKLKQIGIWKVVLVIIIYCKLIYNQKNF